MERAAAFEREFDRAVLAAGGLRALATKVGESAQTLSNWRARGAVAANRCVVMESITGVNRAIWRPQDAGDYWPELVGTEGAPAVPVEEARDAA